MGNDCSDKRTQRTFIDPGSLHQTDIDRLEKGKPIKIQEGLNVTKNSMTNKLDGVPVEWAKKYKLPLEIDMDKTVSTQHLPKQIRPSAQLPRNLLDFIQRKQNKGLSGSKYSYNSKISTKLSVDRNSKYGIRNLTEQLIEEFTSSEISECISEPQQLLQLITLQDQPIDETRKQSKLLTTFEFQKYLSKVKIIDENPGQKYLFNEQIGKGSMCKVYKCASKLNDRILYAVKIINLSENRTVQKIKEQIAAMQMCYSQNIIDYHMTYSYKDSLFIFMEYMEYGNLTKFIGKHYKKIPENIIAYIVFQILKGLSCIHSHWQIHRDLKSDNILINKHGDIKISDFGYSLQFTKEKTSSKDIVGTPAWMAPELITKRDYNESVDIWSLGIIITQLVQGQPRFLRMKPLKAMYMIVSEDPPTLDQCSFEMRVFIRKCLQKDPEKRATLKQLMADPFLKNIPSIQRQRENFKKMLEN